MLKWIFSIIVDVLWSWCHIILFISEAFLCSPTNHMILSTVNQNIRHIIIECFGHGLVGFLSVSVMVLVGFFRTFHRIYGREYHVVGGEHKNTSEMKSTWSQLHKTSNIIEKFHLIMKLYWFGKMSVFLIRKSLFWLEIHVDLRSDNDILCCD